jgi:hypothetical protein
VCLKQRKTKQQKKLTPKTTGIHHHHHHHTQQQNQNLKKHKTNQNLRNPFSKNKKKFKEIQFVPRNKTNGKDPRSWWS